MRTRLGKSGIRYPVISRRERWAAAWSGFLDGRKGLPSGEPRADQLPPACAALHAQYTSLLARMESDYRAVEAGFAEPLQTAVEAMWESPEGDPTAVGPRGRASRRAQQRQIAQITAGREACDDLLNRHERAMADYTIASALANQAMSIYTRHLYRWHSQRADLSARNWLPPTFPMPQERIGVRADLANLVDQLQMASGGSLRTGKE